MNPRLLKVEPMAESFNQPVTKTMIRLKGRWLKLAGFAEGSRVEVHCNQPAVLIVRGAALDKP